MKHVKRISVGDIGSSPYYPLELSGFKSWLARSRNNYFQKIYKPDTSYTELPTPYLFSSFVLPEVVNLCLVCSDISQNYNVLKIPRFLILLLGFPQVITSSVITVHTCE